MRRQRTTLLLLLMLLLEGACVVAVFLTLSRGEPARDTTVETVPVAMTRTITAGVILTGDASDFGWGDPAFAGDYADLSVAGQRVILYENLNPTDRPGVTFEQVVSNIAEYASPTVYFFSVGRLTPDEIKIDERYANTIFIMNLATRADVETLLGVLPATAADINRAVSGDVIAAAPPLVSAPEMAAPARDSDSGAGSLPVLPIAILIAILIVIVLVGGLFGWRWKQGDSAAPARPAKKKTKRQPGTGLHAKSLAIQDAACPTDFAALGEVPPVIHKLSTYVSGDNHYDESFAIELPDNTFLGECGIGIAAPVNKYDKGKVAALEGWLFDKNDIRTASVILGSEYAASDGTLRRQLQSRGNMIEAKPGAVSELETATLRLRICVLDVQYGFSDTLPPRSFFDHLVVELAVWQK